MSKTIEYFYAMGSPWAYIGFAPALELAARYDATLIPRLCIPVKANGGILSKERPEPRRQYWLKDLQRWAKARGKVVVMDDRGGLSDPTPSSLMVIAAVIDGLDWAKLSFALQTPFWTEKADIGDPAVRAALADEAGFDGTALLAREGDADVQAAFEKNKADAEAAGIFGVPTYVYDGELYWGQDSLPFLEKHLNGQA